MVAAAETLSSWLAQALIGDQALTPAQRGVLEAAFHFRQLQGTDYYATRVLGHFLLHCDSGLKVAQIARLLGLCRTTASRQQGLSSKEAIQAAHHRMSGRPYGKLLPRYAGPVAEFLFAHPQATRYDILAFIEQTFDVHVSTVALHHFLKKYGLDAATRQATATTAPTPSAAATVTAPTAPAPPTLAQQLQSVPASPPPLPFVPQGQPVPLPAPPFSAHARSMPALFC